VFYFLPFGFVLYGSPGGSAAMSERYLSSAYSTTLRIVEAGRASFAISVAAMYSSSLIRMFFLFWRWLSLMGFPFRLSIVYLSPWNAKELFLFFVLHWWFLVCHKGARSEQAQHGKDNFH